MQDGEFKNGSFVPSIQQSLAQPAYRTSYFKPTTPTKAPVQAPTGYGSTYFSPDEQAQKEYASKLASKKSAADLAQKKMDDSRKSLEQALLGGKPPANRDEAMMLANLRTQQQMKSDGLQSSQLAAKAAEEKRILESEPTTQAEADAKVAVEKQVADRTAKETAVKNQLYGVGFNPAQTAERNASLDANFRTGAKTPFQLTAQEQTTKVANPLSVTALSTPPPQQRKATFTGIQTNFQPKPVQPPKPVVPFDPNKPKVI